MLPRRRSAFAHTRSSPTCADLARIATGGRKGAAPEAVAASITASLEIITRLTSELASRLLTEGDRSGDPRVIVLYGGALHNDVAPREGRESFSFGPLLSETTRDRYLELDLIVPEFIGDSPAWRSFPWVSSFDADSHPREAVLFSPRPRSFVLVFARSLPAKTSAPPAP